MDRETELQRWRTKLNKFLDQHLPRIGLRRDAVYMRARKSSEQFAVEHLQGKEQFVTVSGDNRYLVTPKRLLIISSHTKLLYCDSAGVTVAPWVDGVIIQGCRFGSPETMEIRNNLEQPPITIFTGGYNHE